MRLLARLLEQALVGFAGFAEIVHVVAGEDEIADQIEEQRVKDFEAVGIVDEIGDQDVMLEKEVIVIAVFDEEKAVLEQFVGIVKILAEKRAARFRERAFLDFAPDAAEGFADLAIDVFLVRLHFGDFRAHDVRLFAVLEMFAAGADPVLALDEHAGKLSGNFRGEVLEERELVQDIALDGLLEFCAGDRGLQNLGEQLAERAMFGRAGLLAVFAVEKADVDALADQILEVFSGEIDEARAEENVIMDVVHAHGKIRQADFCGVGLQLHPGRMVGRRRDADIGHTGAAKRRLTLARRGARCNGTVRNR